MKQTAVKPSGSRSKSGGALGGGLEPPSDIIPEDEKELEKWMKAWSDFLYRYGNLCLDYNDIDNFRHAQGILDEAEFEHITKLYCNPKSKRVLPVRIPKVNALPRIINDIIGRADEHNLTWNVSVVNEEAVEAKLEKLADRQTEDVTRFVRQQSGLDIALGRPLVEGDDLMPVNPADMEERTISTFHQENEKNVSKALKYLLNKKTANFRYKLVHQGLYNYAITGKLAFDTMIDLDDPNLEPIDSRVLVYDRESVSPFIQKGRFCGYYFGLTTQQAIDRCPNLTPDEVNDVQEMARMFKTNALDESFHWFKHPTYHSLYLNGMKQYWKGLRKKLVKLSPNPYDADNPHIHFVSEKYRKDFEKQVEKGQIDGTDVTFEYRYFNVWFECTRLTENVRYQMREMPNQLMDDDEPSEQDGPICGVVDDIPSIIELTKALDNLRIEAFTTISRLTNQAVGKVLIVDSATEDDDEDNLYNMMAFRYYKINTAREGEMQNGRQPMQPKEIDLSLSAAVSDIMRWISFIDQQILIITGLNEQYMGGVKSDQGLGVTQLSNQSAQRALQPYFATFYTVVEQTLQRVCDLMRPAWAGKTVTRHWMGDKMAEWFSMSPETDWHNDKYGIFLQNTVMDDKRHEFMVQMASQLLPIAKDPDLALAVIKMFNSDSAAEAEQIFENGIAAMKKLQAEEQRLRQAEIDSQNQTVAAQEQGRAATEKDKNETTLRKTEMEQKGAMDRLIYQTTHDLKSTQMDHDNVINEKIADKILENREQEVNLQAS